ncbi:hypothetical protein VIGAN_01367100, partial [Vigna angularis var. angularis]
FRLLTNLSFENTYSFRVNKNFSSFVRCKEIPYVKTPSMQNKEEGIVSNFQGSKGQLNFVKISRLHRETKI